MKKNHYNFLTELQSSLCKLYEALDYEPENVKLEIPRRLMRMEKFPNKGSIAEYLGSFISQIESAEKAADNMRLDIRKLKEETKSYKSRISELEDRLKNVPKVVGSGEKKAVPDVQNNSDVHFIKEIISLYDNQIIKIDFIKSQSPIDDSALRVAESFIKEIEALLNKEGVEIINDKGEFSGESQLIVDTKDTEIVELGGTICDTIRVGFRYKDEILRAQEVIVYTHKEAE